MKFFIAFLAFVAAASAFPQDKPIAILRQSQDSSPEGNYQYNYETENGIQASETGALQAVGPKGEQAIVAQGNFQYTAPDGSPISITYVADESGFHATGDHIPVAPAIPEGIQKALAYIAAHPQQPEDESHFRK